MNPLLLAPRDVAESPKQFTGLTASLGGSLLSMLAGCSSVDRFSESSMSETKPRRAPLRIEAAGEPPTRAGDRGHLRARPTQEPPQDPPEDPPHQAPHEPVPRDPRSNRPGYRHISSTDNWDPDSFWYSDRDNIFGSIAVDEWDPLYLINTDRPDFTDVATVVGKGRVQLETGYSNFRTEDDDVTSRTQAVPNSLLRVGTGEDFEARVKWRGFVEQELRDSTGDEGSRSGLSDLELGFKWVMFEQDDLIPMQTWVTRLGVPIGSNDISANKLEPGLSYIYNWQVRRWWFLRGSTGVDVFNTPFATLNSPGSGLAIERDNYFEISQSISSYFQITRNVGSFVEWFMLSRQNSRHDETDHFHNYGLYYYLTPDLQLDARIGWRFGDSFDEHFYALGLSMRF